MVHDRRHLSLCDTAPDAVGAQLAGLSLKKKVAIAERLASGLAFDYRNRGPRPFDASAPIHVIAHPCGVETPSAARFTLKGLERRRTSVAALGQEASRLAFIDHLCITGSGADRPTVTVPLAGEFDLTREAELLDAVMKLDLPASTVVRLEMSRVTSVDGGGLRGMLVARAYLEGRGCELELLRPNSQLRRVLAVTGLEELLTIVDERR